ncbi:hypothetical protein [Halopenitus sp. POP-27]|uniref:hypothetical protein n=1 Tax=Halopenitus sp. POP-27 TaxID=2994425 RepID=UPI002469441D|nr:hypothetical protein [Halopenitus sp. POP-27]
MTDLPADAEPFADWVAETAAARGVSEQELLNQLVSALWVLDELDNLRRGSGDGSVGDGEDRSGSSTAEDSVAVPGFDSSDVGTEDADAEQSAAETAEPGVGDDDRDDTTDSVADDAVGDVAESDAATDSAEDDAATDSAESDDADGMAGDRQDVLEALLESADVASGSGSAPDTQRLERQLHDLSLDVEDQRKRHDRYTDRISDEITRINGRVRTLEESTERFLTADDLDPYATEAAVDREIGDLEDWIDAEFDDIEALFEHVLSMVDDLESQIDDRDAAIRSAFESELASIRSRLDDRDRLAALRREAMTTGIRTAACADCGETVDLALLEAPRCPDCTATFRAVEPAGWNPFASATLRTGPTDPPIDASDGADDDPLDGDA